MKVARHQCFLNDGRCTRDPPLAVTLDLKNTTDMWQNTRGADEGSTCHTIALNSICFDLVIKVAHDYKAFIDGYHKPGTDMNHPL